MEISTGGHGHFSNALMNHVGRLIPIQVRLLGARVQAEVSPAMACPKRFNLSRNDGVARVMMVTKLINPSFKSNSLGHFGYGQAPKCSVSGFDLPARRSIMAMSQL